MSETTKPEVKQVNKDLPIKPSDINPMTKCGEYLLNEETGETLHLSLLPTPAYCHILVRPAKVEKTSKGGIIKPDMTTEAEHYHQVEGTILKLGPYAFTDRETAEPFKKEWNKVGDRIMFPRYGSQRYAIAEIGDDGVEVINGISLMFIKDMKITGTLHPKTKIVKMEN